MNSASSGDHQHEGFDQPVEGEMGEVDMDEPVQVDEYVEVDGDGVIADHPI
jgi:hypothetical protein